MILLYVYYRRKIEAYFESKDSNNNKHTSSSGYTSDKAEQNTSEDDQDSIGHHSNNGHNSDPTRMSFHARSVDSASTDFSSNSIYIKAPATESFSSPESYHIGINTNVQYIPTPYSYTANPPQINHTPSPPPQQPSHHTITNQHTQKLILSDIHEYIHHINSKWILIRDNTAIQRIYPFNNNNTNFNTAVAFMSHIADECKRFQHYPEWSHVNNQVNIILTTTTTTAAAAAANTSNSNSTTSSSADGGTGAGKSGGELGVGRSGVTSGGLSIIDFVLAKRMDDIYMYNYDRQVHIQT